MKLSKRTIIFIILILATVGGAYYYYFYPKNTSNNNVVSSQGGNWLYRRSLTIPNSEGTLMNKEVQIEIDTASLISIAKLQDDCDDLRFVDIDGTSYLSYWIETGCNTTSTNIRIIIPNLPDGGKTIYMYYGNDTAINAEDSAHTPI